MYIAQYYADSTEKRKNIIAIAVLLNCQYRTVENIITVQINNNEVLDKLKTSKLLPWVIQKDSLQAV